MQTNMKDFDSGNGMHSYLLPPCETCGVAGPCEHYPFRPAAVNGVNPCTCGQDPRTCGHFNDARDTYGPFDARNKPNWMSHRLFQEAAHWCKEHIDEITWTLKGEYPDGSLGAIPLLASKGGA